MSLLEAIGLHAGYGETKALHGLDFAVEEGGVTALLGANGAGKTTTLRAICGMIRTEGEIHFNGARIDGQATETIVGRGIAHVPDGRGTFMELTVEENLRLVPTRAATRPRFARDFQRVFQLFPAFAGTQTPAGRHALGRRAADAGDLRAPCCWASKLLLLDEPSFGLAPLIVREIFEIMHRINRDDGVSILVVEQNASLALAIADRAYLLETGRIVMSGPAKGDRPR